MPEITSIHLYLVLVAGVVLLLRYVLMLVLGLAALKKAHRSDVAEVVRATAKLVPRSSWGWKRKQQK
ncbi:hypothetical protein LRS58_19090 [Rhodococcus sp. BH2-1]|nr:hypothetical protein [Rhodococcus sp. BH2-1]